MSSKKFTQAELLELKNNPYVKHATENMVKFTVAFKEQFWKEYYKEGRSPKTILKDMDIEPDVLGHTRIHGIVQHLKQSVNNGEEFRDIRKVANSVFGGIDKHGKALSPSKSLLFLHYKVDYLEQEVEFIKKIILADKKVNLK